MSGTVYNVSEPLVAGVKHFEGYYARPYLCPTGYPTIGYGHVIKSSEKETLTHLTEPEATALLRKDLNEALKDALRIMPGLAKSQQQLDAITSWVFNLGATNLQNSTLKKLYVSGHHDQAAAEITRWVEKRMQAFGDDRDAIRAFATELVAALCRRLLNGGAPALHFYTLNLSRPTLDVLRALA